MKAAELVALDVAERVHGPGVRQDLVDAIALAIELARVEGAAAVHSNTTTARPWEVLGVGQAVWMDAFQAARVAASWGRG